MWFTGVTAARKRTGYHDLGVGIYIGHVFEFKDMSVYLMYRRYATDGLTEETRRTLLQWRVWCPCEPAALQSDL